MGLKMEKLTICRICLVENVRMFIVANKNLQELYEKLTGIPFVTEDCRPMQACFFCYAKLKQCYQLLRKCLEAKEVFAQMLNEDYEKKPLRSQSQLKFSGLIKTPIEHISIVDVSQIECNVIKEEQPADSEIQDDIELNEEHQSDELELESLDNTYPDQEDIPPNHSESISEDDTIIMKFETEVDEEEGVFKKKRRVKKTKHQEDISPNHSESVSEDVIPLINFETEVNEKEGVFKKKRRVKKTKSLGCDTEIELVPDVSNKLNTLRKPRTRKVKVKNIDRTVTASKTAKQTTVRPQREIHKHLQNIRNILLHSNATPIRRHTGRGYICGFCPDHFTIPRDLKIHTQQKHNNEISIFMKGRPLFGYVVKLDITGLKCEICGQDIEGLETLMDHLRSEHNTIIHTDIKNRILPFKFEGHTLKCVLCPKIYERFILLQEHMNMHYSNYNCEISNSPFVSKSTISRHLARHKKGDISCKFCSKVFDTKGKKLCHEKFVHIGDKRSKFTTHAKKHEHMVKEYGAEPRVFKCMACDKTFDKKDKLTLHTKRIHLLERKNKCDHCDMKFYAKEELNMHMLKHTGKKQYTCDSCLESYGRESSLRVHMSRIHADDR